MRKIHCINAISKYGTDQFTEDYELTDEVNEAEGILVRSASLHEMQFSNSLLAIARAGAGVNNIPLDACAQEGIVVFNTPGANANGVKELVLAGLFLASRDIVGGIEWCKENKDDANIGKTAEKAKKAFAGCEIKGKKLGVVGLGAIGAEVANAAIALGMEVYGYDPYISVNAAWRLSRDVKHTTSLDTICQECDYITLHVPAVDSTKGIINKAAIDQMKDGVVIVNTARGGLIDSDALIAGVESGKVGAAALDVVENEFGLYYYDHKSDVLSNRQLAILRSFPNVTVSHHMAFYTDNYTRTVIRDSLTGCRLFLDGKQNPWEVC